MVQLRVLVIYLGLSPLFLRTWSSVIGDRNAVNIENQISIQDAPYMAAVFLNNKYICGASIIHEEFILTAAQCFYGNGDSDDDYWEVLVGSDELNTGGIFILVDYPVCHEEYNDSTTENDICVLKLAGSVPLGCFWNVGVVRLPLDERKILDGTMVNVLGWYTAGDAGSPLVYNGVQVGVISYGWTDCDKKPAVFTDVASYTPWINNITKFNRTL